MGSISSVQIDHADNSSCNSCSKNKDANCCASSVKFFKVKTPHIAVVSHPSFGQMQIAIVIRRDLPVLLSALQIINNPLQVHGPPRSQGQPVYLMNAAFLI
jgi:hypothetical protein